MGVAVVEHSDTQAVDIVRDELDGIVLARARTHQDALRGEKGNSMLRAVQVGGVQGGTGKDQRRRNEHKVQGMRIKYEGWQLEDGGWARRIKG